MPPLAINPFDTIKETLNITEVVANYGIKVKRSNQALCPFHNERTPSFTIYPKTNSFKCFGCGVGGSVIDFAMLMHGTDALEAAKMLDNDYSLGLFDYRPTQEELRQLSEQQERRNADKGLNKAFEDYINKAHDLLCDYLHLLHDWKVTHAPKSINDTNEPHHLFVEACHELDYIEYLADFLLNADIDEKIGFYKTHREELRKIATRLRTISTKADESVR
jgi:hypothetical protein